MAGTRTLDQRLKRALLYRLSYQPAPWEFATREANVPRKLAYEVLSRKRMSKTEELSNTETVMRKRKWIVGADTRRENR